jgi:hypothetical protein
MAWCLVKHRGNLTLLYLINEVFIIFQKAEVCYLIQVAVFWFVTSCRDVVIGV